MVTNERQFRIAKAQLKKLKESLDSFDMRETTRRTGSEILVRAELDALRSEYDILREQIQEYQTLKSGTVTILRARNLAELPGILIRARIARGLTQRQLAAKLGLKQQQIQRYEAEGYASASLRRFAEVAKALELNVSEVGELSQDYQGKARRDWDDIEGKLFPVKEMYRRNWFEGFSGSLSAAFVEADSLVKDFLKSTINSPEASLHRQRVRSESIMDPYALLAWECRILKLAEKSPASGTYNLNSLDDDWLKGLVRESYYEDGPRRARDYLDQAGISLQIEPHLPHIHLDGAAILSKGKPVIGLTLRYDRLDNFWFMLLHEVIHVIRHLRRSRIESIFDDVDADPDELEREADEFAGQVLIPEQVWETALARYVRTEESVTSLAKVLCISPSIIGGRIRKEANNYVILSGMIGQGEVRKHFPEVKFGL